MTISTSEIKYIFENAKAAVIPLAKSKRTAEAKRDEALAALKSGYSGNGTEKDIERTYKTTVSDFNAQIKNICDETREKLNNSIASSFVIDAETAARFDSVFRNCKLSDFDLENIVRDNPSYTVLKMAASVEGSSFAKSLRARLQEHQDVINEGIDRAVRIIKNTDSNSWYMTLRGDDIDTVLADLDSENCAFSDFLAGKEQVPTNGLLGVLERVGA